MIVGHVEDGNFHALILFKDGGGKTKSDGCCAAPPMSFCQSGTSPFFMQGTVGTSVPVWFLCSKLNIGFPGSITGNKDVAET